MKILTVDVAVIGAGTAGLAAYRAARARGARAVIIEAGPYGTTCARVGCMPSKLLIAAAEAAHAIDEAPGFGVHVDGREARRRPRGDGPRASASATASSASCSRASRRFRPPTASPARPASSTATRSRSTATRASRRAPIVIATGSRPPIPAMLAGRRRPARRERRRLLVGHPAPLRRRVRARRDRPGARARRSRAWACAWSCSAAAGASGPLTDPVVRDAVAAGDLRRSSTLDPDAHVTRVDPDHRRRRGRVHAPRRRGAHRVLRLRARRHRPPPERGRPRPRVASGSSSTRPACRASTRPRCAWATTQPLHRGRRLELHPAAARGRGRGAHRGRERRAPAGRGAGHAAHAARASSSPIPQIAIVGGGYDKLVPGTFEAGEVSFEDQGRARVMRRNRGHLRVYADRATGRFLGRRDGRARPPSTSGTCSRGRAANRMTVASMLEMPFYHPVVEEGLRTALRDLDAKLSIAPGHRRVDGVPGTSSREAPSCRWK